MAVKNRRLTVLETATPFREPSPTISDLLKFAFSTEKRENTLNVSIRFLTHNKSLRKKVESSTKAVYKKA